MRELPPGWEWTTIGEIGRYLNGRGFKKSEWSGSGRPIIRIQNLTGSGAAFNYYRGEADERHTVHDGDLLVSWAATLGVYVWRGPEAVLNQHIFKVDSHIRPEFHRWLLDNALADLQRQTHGSGMVHITKGRFDSTRVPLPPLAEQERIVAAIEEHLSRLDAAESGMRSAAARLSTMRSSLLEEVTRGDWASWPLGEVLLSLRNGCFVSRPKVDPPGLPILRISAVRPLALDPADVRYAPDSLDRAAEYEVRAGDLLFTRYSGNPDYVGACAVVPPEGAGMLHPDKLIRGVPDPALALSGWIAMAASASVGRRQIEQRLKTTAGQVGISGSQLKSVPIPLPPLDEQAARHRRWEDGLEAMTRLRSEIELCSARAEGARRSILATAFSGRLVPQDPDDEPASVLLERIRAERAAAAPTKRSRKAKVS